MLSITLPGRCTDTSLPIYSRDPLLSDAKGGVRFLFDGAFYSYPSQAAATTDMPLRDISEHEDGALRIVSGKPLPFSGRGFDFSGYNAGSPQSFGLGVEIPGSVATDLWAETGQYFAIVLYLKLPTAETWFSATGSTSLFAFTATPNGFSTPEADILTIVMTPAPSTRWFTLIRQTNGGTVDQMSVTPAAGDLGQFAQLAYARTPTAQIGRLKTATNTVLQTKAVGVENAGNFSGKKGIIGAPRSFASSSASARNFKLYRAFVENLRTSGRDPISVWDADWARTVARGVFS